MTAWVINESFYVPAPPEPLPEPALWEQPWFWDLLRQVGGILLVLFLIFGVLKPTMQRLTRSVVIDKDRADADAVSGDLATAKGAGQSLPNDGLIQLPGPGSYEKTLDAARGMIAEDPKRVAQVVKKWIAEDAR